MNRFAAFDNAQLDCIIQCLENESGCWGCGDTPIMRSALHYEAYEERNERIADGRIEIERTNC